MTEADVDAWVDEHALDILRVARAMLIEPPTTEFLLGPVIVVGFASLSDQWEYLAYVAGLLRHQGREASWLGLLSWHMGRVHGWLWRELRLGHTGRLVFTWDRATQHDDLASITTDGATR